VRSCVALIALACGCGRRDEPAGPLPPATPGPSPHAESALRGAGEVEGGSGEGTRIAGSSCTLLPFADTTTLPEASGAAWLELDGTLGLVVVSDGGHAGAFVVLDPENGRERKSGKLPLGSGASDDTEGLAARGDRMYGLTSSGYVRVWEWRSGTFVLVDGPYPIGTGSSVCEATGINCGRDYEGLALAPAGEPRVDTPNSCIGFACSREDGALYCVSEQGGRLRVDLTRTIAVENKGALADCAFSETGALYAGNNLFGMAKVHRIDGWSEPATAKVTALESLGVGFPEVVAARGDVIYRFSDTGGSSPSLLAKFRCPAPTR
jgi:hypothetical protein